MHLDHSCCDSRADDQRLEAKLHVWLPGCSMLELLNWDTNDSWAGSFSVVACPVHCRVLGTIPGLHALEAVIPSWL